MSGLVVVEPGLASTVQDRGRIGLAHLGVPASGAVDPALAALANRLVGNRPDAAVLETAGGLVVRAVGAVTVVTTSDRAPRTVADGTVVRLDTSPRQWQYLAVRGGVDLEPVLGSRSSDTLSGLGPPPLSAGDALPVGPEPDADIADLAPFPIPGDLARIGPGPRLDWFDDGVLELMRRSHWTVTATSRVGVRLRGVPVPRRIGGELPSEGLVRGAIQVPPDGDPIMMLADHPTTGGYPVVAVVHPDDVAIVGQRPAGTTVRFRS